MTSASASAFCARGAPEYSYGGGKIPAINASAARDSGGVVHIALVNLDPVKRTTVRMKLGSVTFGSVQGQVVTSSAFNDYNSFEQPGRVVPVVFNGAKKDGADVVADLPPMSVVVLALKN